MMNNLEAIVAGKIKNTREATTGIIMNSNIVFLNSLYPFGESCPLLIFICVPTRGINSNKKIAIEYHIISEDEIPFRYILKEISKTTQKNIKYINFIAFMITSLFY